MTVLLSSGRTLSKTLLPRSGPLLTRLTSSHPTLRVSVVNGRETLSQSSQAAAAQSTPFSLPIRTYATVQNKPVGRPKAHTGRTATKRTTTRSTTAKKPAPKKAAKKPATKKAKAKAKPKPKAKPKKREPTAASLARQEKKERTELKKRALLTGAPKQLPATAWAVCFTENGPKKGEMVDRSGTAAKRAAQIYRNVSLEERERLNHVANDNKSKNEVAYKNWLASFTPLQIKDANNARDHLRRLQTKDGAPSNGRKKTYRHIQDERLVKRPVNPYAQFLKDRVASGDLNGMTVSEIGKLISREYKELGGAQKKTYEDRYKADRNRYFEEATSVYGSPPPGASASAPA